MRQTAMKKIILAAATAMFVAACAQNPYTGEHAKTAGGATIGAGAGAPRRRRGRFGRPHERRPDRRGDRCAIGGLVGRQMDKQEAELRSRWPARRRSAAKGDTIRLQAPENITFDTNRADVKPQFQRSWASSRKASSSIRTPSCRSGAHRFDRRRGLQQTLSENRAGAVRSYLIRQGVAANRLAAVGYGATRPVADNSSVAGRAQNRRVEVLIVPTQASAQQQQQQQQPAPGPRY